MILEAVAITSFIGHVAAPTSSNFDSTWHTAVEFWTEAMCCVPRTKTVNFHGIFRNGSPRLRYFFDTLLRTVNKRCDAVILAKTHEIWDSENSTASHEEVYNQPCTRNRKLSCPEYFRLEWTKKSFDDAEINESTDMWNINMIFVEDSESLEEILIYRRTFEWSPRENFIVLTAWKEEQEDEREHDWDVVIEEILKTFWSKFRIQNVFLNEPLAKHGGYVMHTYNPFARVNDTTWGMLEEIEVRSQKQMLDLLSSLTYRRTINLNRYRLNVSLFEQFQGVMKLPVKPRPGSVYDYSGGYNGSDGIILGTIAKYMNFRPNIVYPTDGIKFGYQKRNGTYVGALGDVVYHRTDVCFVSFFVKTYGADMSLMEFTTHVHFDWVCVVVPKAFQIPKWLRIYHFFQPSVWICTALSQIIFFFVWCYIQLLRSRRSKKIDIWDTVYRAFLISTGYPQKLPTSTPERILLTGILIAAVTITGTFNGILYKSFAHNMYYEDIDRLSDLDKTGLPIQYTSHGMSDLFGRRNDSCASPVIKSLQSKLGYGNKSIKHAAIYRNVTGLIRKHNFPLVRKKHVDADGSHLLHLATECPSSYYLSYVLPKNSILRERINVLIGRLNQGGFTQLWTVRTLQHFASVMRINIEKERSHGEDFVAFKLTDLQTSFYTLGLGWLLSTIVFFHEKGWLKCCFDKGRLLARNITCRINRKLAAKSK